MKFLTTKKVSQLLKKIGHKIFVIYFLKVDGTVRRLVGRFGVTKHLAGGEFGGSHIPTLKPVFDMQKKEYRCFYMDRVISIKCGRIHA